MTRTQRRIVVPAVIATGGTAATFGTAVLLVLLPMRHGMDSSAYLAVFTVGLLITLAGIQLAGPKRRRAAR